MSESYLDDDMLVAKAQEGDRSAFNALVRKHEARAYKYAYRLTRNSDEAADVVAEAFVRVFNALKNFKGQSSFVTWLYRILTNCFLDTKKRDRSKLSISLEDAYASTEAEIEQHSEDKSGSPSDHAERNERERRMQRALGFLAEYQRAMIVMYHSEMMSYDEIAAALDLPVGTVKSRLNRARLSLREILKRDEELFRI